MVKYSKKHQKFITDLYGYDLERFEERVESLTALGEEYIPYLPTLEMIFQYSRELIRKDTKNTEKLFNLAENVQEELHGKWNVVEEKFEGNELKYKEEYDLLWNVLDSLRILSNLHPDRIQTWEEALPTGYTTDVLTANAIKVFSVGAKGELVAASNLEVVLFNEEKAAATARLSIHKVMTE